MKLWKVLGIVFGMYGLVGPFIWRIIIQDNLLCILRPLGLLCYPATLTLVLIQRFFGLWNSSYELIPTLEFIPILVSFPIQISIWFVIGSFLGFAIEKTRLIKAISIMTILKAIISLILVLFAIFFTLLMSQESASSNSNILIILIDGLIVILIYAIWAAIKEDLRK